MAHSLRWHSIHNAWRFYEWPALDNIPLVKMHLNATLLNSDFFTQSYIATPREVFSTIISRMARLFEAQWWEVFFFLKVLTALISIPLIYVASAVHVSNCNKLLFSMIFIGFAWFALDRETVSFSFLAGILPMFTEPTAHTLAALFGFVGIALAAKESLPWLTAASLMFFASAVIHPAVGLCCAAFLGALIIAFGAGWTKRQEIFRLVIPGIGALVGAGVIKIFYSKSSSLSLAELIQIYIVERHPHHYLMTYIFSHEWRGYLVSTVALCLPAIIGFFLGMRKVVRVSLIFLVFFVLPPFAQYFFVEIFPVRAVVLLGPARFHMFTYWMIAIAWGYLIASIDWQRLGLRMTARPSGDRSRSAARRPLALISIGLTLFLTIGSVGATYRAHLVDPEQLLPRETADLFRWVKKNTPVNSVFQVAATGLSSFDIRIFAERGIMGDVGFPFNEPLILEWRERANSFSIKQGRPVFPSKFDLDYVVVNSSDTVRCKVLYHTNSFAVIDVRSCD